MPTNELTESVGESEQPSVKALKRRLRCIQDYIHEREGTRCRFMFMLCTVSMSESVQEEILGWIEDIGEDLLNAEEEISKLKDRFCEIGYYLEETSASESGDSEESDSEIGD